MPTATVIAGGVLLDDGAGHKQVFKMEADTTDPNRPLAVVNVYNIGSTLLGTPHRYHQSSGRIACDFPGVDPGSFIVGAFPSPDPANHVTEG